MTELSTIRLQCPAKLNLALGVGVPDPITRMHPIASWMIGLTVSDHLVISHATDVRSSFDIAFIDASRQVDWPIEKDLGYRAHALLQEHVGRTLSVAVTLRKSIPAGAGLGGGSSNAAGVLVGLNKLFNLAVPDDQLVALGLKLGSDVGFAVNIMLGRTAAIVTGYGEKIAPLPPRDIIPVVLIYPGFGSPTGHVYAEYDRGPAGSADEARARALSALSPVPQDAPYNDLAEPACRVSPRLGDLRAKVAAVLGLPVHVTGSGSTLYVIAPSATAAKVLARKVNVETGLEAVATRTL